MVDYGLGGLVDFGVQNPFRRKIRVQERKKKIDLLLIERKKKESEYFLILSIFERENLIYCSRVSMNSIPEQYPRERKIEERMKERIEIEEREP